MKKKLLSIFYVVFATFAFQTASAQYYRTTSITSGFNADVIANGIGSAASSTNIDVDGVNFAFVSRDFQLTASSTPLTYGLPISEKFTSVVATTPGLKYQLGSYSANNDLRLKNINDIGTLTLATPVAATNIYILATGGSGASTIQAKVGFSDGTSQIVTGLAVGDWYNATGFALQGIGRISRLTDALESGGGTNPRLYQIPISIDAVNQSKLIEAVTITKTAGTGNENTTNVFAISVNKYTTCPAPTLVAATNLSQISATVNFTATATVPSNGYEIYYSSSNVDPLDSDPATISNISGTSTIVNGLTANTTYYVWSRSNCGGTTGPWGVSNTFKTLCGPVTSLNENIDSYATGNIVPDCFGRLVSGTGTASISSTTPVASGNRHLYQISSTAANSTVIVLPIFSNVNAGTNWLKFKARSSNATGAAIQVGYVTDDTNATTFVSLFSFDVTNLTYDLSANKTFVIPNTIPANARLAVKNTGTKTGGFYWDDIIWETLPSCQPPSNPVKNGATTSSISLSWTAPTTAPSSYDIFYSTTNTAPTAASIPQVTGILSNTKNITGLTPSTTYYFWVRSNCGTSQSDWVGSVSAYTGTCLPTGGSTSTLYYLNNITTTGGFTNLGYTASAYNAYVDNSTTVLNSVASGVINYTLTPSASTNYYYIWIDYNNDLDFDDADETVLATTSYTANITGSFTIPTTVPQGTYRMRFAQSYIGNITACGPAPYGGYVDFTLSLGAPPSCLTPSAFAASGITLVSAILNWTASISTPAAGYDLYYSTSNTPPTSATVPNLNVSGTTTTLSSLNSATTYYVWIRSRCSSTEQSAWLALPSFTTLIPPASNDICSNAISLTPGANFAQNAINSSNVGATTDGTASCQANSAKNVWFKFVVPASGSITLETDAASSNSLTDTVLAAYSTAVNNDCTTSTSIGCDDDAGNGNYSLLSLTSLTPGSTVFVSVWVWGGAALQEGNFRISAYDGSLGTLNVTKDENDIKLYPNPFTDFIRISEVKNVTSISIIDMSGRAVKTMKPATELKVGDLQSGMYLINLKMKDGSVQTVKAIKK